MNAAKPLDVSTLRTEESIGPQKALPRPLALAARAVAVVAALYHLTVALVGIPTSMVHRPLHLTFMFVLIFFLSRSSRSSRADRVPLVDWVLIGLTLVMGIYTIAQAEWIMSRLQFVTPLSAPEWIIGTLTILLTLEASRRALGPQLPIVALVFLAYALLGQYIPGSFGHKGFSLEALLEMLYLTNDGIWGVPVAVSSTFIILFILFGAFFEKSGVGQFFTDFSTALAGSSRGGPGKISVISSSLFGTISGSSVANVAVDGWHTIPLMKRTGFRPPFAAAVEATASTGGQIMPPVMGAAAFVMAEFSGVPYGTIIIHAAVPAILYYVALFSTIHFEALREDLRGIPKEERRPVGEALRRRGYLLIPVAVMLGLLMIGYTPIYACMVSIGLVVAVSWVRAETRLGWRGVLAALEEGAKGTLSSAAACACAGIIIGVIFLTGLGLKFTSLVIAVAGGSLLASLFLTMIAGIVLGMGMPTTPAYIIQAALLVPALIKLGLVPIAAHMFIFYFACISAITPPVALASYVAAGIAEASLWQTGWEAFKLGLTGFIVPYMFAYEPSLLLVGPWPPALLATATAAAGVILLAAAVQGWWRRALRPWERLLLFAAALLLIKPGWVTDLIGLALAGLVLLAHSRRAGRG